MGTGRRLLGKLRTGGDLFSDFKYSDGLMSVSLSEGDGNLGGMNGSTICLLSRFCRWRAPLLFVSCCTWRSESDTDSPKSVGNDSGRFSRR